MKGSSLKWGFSEMIGIRLRWMAGNVSNNSYLRHNALKNAVMTIPQNVICGQNSDGRIICLCIWNLR